MSRPNTLISFASLVGATILASLSVNNITWQADNIIRYTFDSSPSLVGALQGHVLVVIGATNAENNGQFRVTTVTSTYIEVQNTARKTDLLDETGSPATASVIFDGAILAEMGTSKLQAGFVFKEVLSEGHFNFHLKYLWEWINHFATDGIFQQYEDIAGLQGLSLDTINIDSSYRFVKDYGLYSYNKLALDVPDDNTIVKPTELLITDAGRWELMIANPENYMAFINPSMNDHEIRISQLESKIDEQNNQIEQLKQYLGVVI